MVATLYVSAAIFLQSATANTWSLQNMWSTMSTLPRVVVGILFVLSVYSFGVMIDRALMYSAARKQSRVFVQQVAGALKEGKLDEAIAIAERNKKSHIAKVVATGSVGVSVRLPAGVRLRRGGSGQARSGALHRHRARRNEARALGSRDDWFDGAVRGTVRHGGRNLERV